MSARESGFFTTEPNSLGTVAQRHVGASSKSTGSDSKGMSQEGSPLITLVRYD